MKKNFLKAISFFVIFWLLTQNIFALNLEKNQTNTIDKTVESLTFEQIKTLNQKIKSQNFDSYDEYTKNILNYLLLKTEEKIIENQKSISIFELTNKNITENDKKLVEKKILALQSNLLSEIQEKIFYLENSNKYIQKGNIRTNFSFENKSWNINFLNFENINSWNDFKLNWNLEINLKDFNLKSFVDLIRKDWDNYIFMKNIDFSWDKNFSEMLKKIFSENKFVKITNYESFDYNFALSKILLSQPLFEAYKKSGNDYFLIPTKFFCDCTDKQYQKFLENFITYWELKLNLMENKISIKFFDKYSTINGEIYLENNNFYEIKFLWFFPKTYNDKSDFISLNYKKNNYFDFVLNSSEWNLNLKSKLDTKNNLVFAELLTKFEDFNWSLKFENKKISWNLVFEKNYFDINLLLDDKFKPVSWSFEMNIWNKIKTRISGEKWIFKGKTSFDDWEINHKFIFDEKDFFIENDFVKFSEKISWRINFSSQNKHNNKKINLILEVLEKNQEKIKFVLDADLLTTIVENVFIDAPKNFIKFENINF